MIIWRGWGILAALIPAAVFILFVAVFGLLAAVFGAKGAAVANSPYMGLLMVLVPGACSAALVWWLGRKLNSGPTRELVDPKTGQRVVLRKEHSLFWIPMQWWAIPIALIVLLVGVPVLITMLSRAFLVN